MFGFSSPSNSAKSIKREPMRSRSPRLEVLEDRRLLSVAVTVNFDAIDAFSAGRDGARGQVVADYLAGYGITVDGTPRVLDSRYYSPVLVAPSSPNVFNAPTTRQYFTFHFNVPLESFSVTRAGLHVVDSSGTTHPEWSAAALDAQGNELASISEPLLARFQDIPAKQFTMTAAGITSVRFYSDNRNFAGFGSPLLDDFILTENASDIAMQSAQLQAGNTVQFTYETTGNPGPFQVGLYRSTDGITYNPADLIATQPVTPSPTNPQTPGTVTLPSPWTSDPTKPYLLIVADPPSTGKPRGDILETNDTNVPNNNNSLPVKGPDLTVSGVGWNKALGGLDVRYEVKGGPLHKDTRLAIYWANGPRMADRLGAPLFTAPLKRAMGKHGPVHVPESALMNLPFEVAPTPRLLATHLVVVLDHDNVIAEPDDTGDGTRPSNNVKELGLSKVRVKAGFNLTFTHPDGTRYALDTTLLTNFMRLAARLVGQNLVTGDIWLSEGVRDPRVAHRWSTAWSIRNRRVPLATLRALPGGKDLDGNLWYNAAWENGLKDSTGKWLPGALATLWGRIDANARRVDGRRNPDFVAAEGYAVGDKHRSPNTYQGVSKHCVGKAIDASIPWRAGARFGALTIRNGDLNDTAANWLIARYGLRRPVLRPTPERHHFEL